MRRQHQRVAAAAPRTRRANRGSAPSGSPSGSAGHTLTLVLILGSSMSPEISTPRVGEYERRVLRRMAVARDDAPVVRPPARPCRRRCSRSNDVRQLRARRAGSGCRARRAPRRARPPCRARRNSAQVSAGRMPRALADDRVRGQVLGRASSRPARRSARRATPRCRGDRDGSAWRRCAGSGVAPSVVAKCRSHSARVARVAVAAIDERAAVVAPRAATG